MGQPVGVFYGYKTDGVFATDEEAAAAGRGGYLAMIDETGARQNFKAGDIHFVDINGDVWMLGDGYIYGNKYDKKYAVDKNLNLQDLDVYADKYLLQFYEDGSLVCYDLNNGKKLYRNKAYTEEIDAAIALRMAEITYKKHTGQLLVDN